ncbi:MAG: ROK family transcriptional regulator [Planctomycetes bacterium]|nr:ROK family transcriptional regulator [Planctomycetota bacterium]
MRDSQSLSILTTRSAHGRNRRTVLDCIRSEGPLSGADLARALDVPSGTITRVVGSLRSDRLVTVRQSEEKAGVGRPPKLVDVNGEFAYFVGVELGSYTTRIVITDFKGEVCDAEVFSTESMASPLPEALASRVREFTREKLSGDDVEKLRAIAVGLCGDVSLDGGATFGGFLPRGTELAPALEKALGRPVFLDNDANMAARAEFVFGAAQGLQHVVCLFDRGWVGCGLVLNGVLYRGAHNAAGELSAPSAENAEETGKGSFPPPFLESLWLEKALQEKDHRLTHQEFETRADMIDALCEAARRGDDHATELIKGQTEMLALAFQRAGVLFDPELLVLTGDWAVTGEWGRRMIQDRLKELWKASGCANRMETPDLIFSELGQNIVCLGAVATALDAVSGEVSSNGTD